MSSSGPDTRGAPVAAETSGAPEHFELRRAIELDKQALAGRLAFAGVYALFALAIMPWPLPAAWMLSLVAWELLSPHLFRWMRPLSDDAAMSTFAFCNVIASCLYSSVALASLAIGSPIGVAIGATWLSGSFMNSFIFFGEHRRILWSSIGPAIAAAVIGPSMIHGLAWPAIAVSVMILTALVAARSFSLDHQVLLKRLGERQSALAEVERKLAIAVEASGDGLFEVDFVADVRSVNASWAAMLGYDLAEIDCSPLLRLVHPDDRVMLREGYAAHFRGETPQTSIEVRMLCKDGGYKWVLSRGRLVSRTPDGDPWRLIGTTIDISARKALEFQLERARDVAEQANEAKSTFVANMSHEIRTPLNGVIGVAGALARTPLSAQQRDMVDLVQSSAKVLERLLSDILDQSKLEAGDFELQIAPFDLRQTIEAAAELMRSRAEEKGLSFAVGFTAAADGAFRGDAVRLRQVVSNLTANAIKFTQQGEVRIDVTAADPAGAAGPCELTITVCDTGIGFDSSTAQRLFARFVQADGSISRRFGGTGLGLAISKALTERMGGRIDVESAPGIGSRFTVVLPLERMTTLPSDQAGEAEAAPSEAVADREAGAALGELRILVAEDHPTNQRVIELILGPLGVRLTMANDGQEAVDLFRPGAFDLVLMDMQMPRLDGLTATREIRRLEREAGVGPTPIAMLTANAMDEHRLMAFEAGADHHISKPFTPESLFAGIGEALAVARGPAADRSLSAAGGFARNKSRLG